ncbi:hypothetical protein ACWHA3_01020 [Streptomyces cyaneofuscatus]
MPSRFEYERAVRHSDLPSLSRLLALTVATWADVRTGTIPDRLQPSLTTLEDATGMVRSSVRTHLNKLEDGGWLKRDRPAVAAARSKKARTKYRLLVPKGAVVPDSDGVELGQELPNSGAGAALVDTGLGQELPQPRAGDALALGQEMSTTRAGAALSSSCSSGSSDEYQLQAPPPAVVQPGTAVATVSGRGEVQPLIDAMGVRQMRVSWSLQTQEWIELRDAVRRVGVPALVEHAAAKWRAAKTTPFSARYFLPGWIGLQAEPEYTGPRSLTAGPPSKTNEYLEDMAAIAAELRQMRTGGA